MTKYIWLTENMSHSLTRQGAEVGAEEDAEDVGEEGHVMERVGGVQQTRNFREQIGYQIHLWKRWVKVSSLSSYFTRIEKIDKITRLTFKSLLSPSHNNILVWCDAKWCVVWLCSTECAVCRSRPRQGLTADCRKNDCKLTCLINTGEEQPNLSKLSLFITNC